jgi:hypothetical protein
MTKISSMKLANAYRSQFSLEKIVLLDRFNVLRAVSRATALRHPHQADRAYCQLIKVSQLVRASSPLRAQAKGLVEPSRVGRLLASRMSVGEWDVAVNQFLAILKEPRANKVFNRQLHFHNVQLPFVGVRLERLRALHMASEAAPVEPPDGLLSSMTEGELFEVVRRGTASAIEYHMGRRAHRGSWMSEGAAQTPLSRSLSNWSSAAQRLGPRFPAPLTPPPPRPTPATPEYAVPTRLRVVPTTPASPSLPPTPEYAVPTPRLKAVPPAPPPSPEDATLTSGREVELTPLAASTPKGAPKGAPKDAPKDALKGEAARTIPLPVEEPEPQPGCSWWPASGRPVDTASQTDKIDYGGNFVRSKPVKRTTKVTLRSPSNPAPRDDVAPTMPLSAEEAEPQPGRPASGRPVDTASQTDKTAGDDGRVHTRPLFKGDGPDGGSASWKPIVPGPSDCGLVFRFGGRFVDAPKLAIPPSMSSTSSTSSTPSPPPRKRVVINAMPEHEPLIMSHGAAVAEMWEVMEAEARRGRRFTPSAVAAAMLMQKKRAAVAVEALKALEAMAAMSDEEDPQSVLEPTGMDIVEEPPTLRAPPSLRSIRPRQLATPPEPIAYPPDSTDDGDTTI